MAHRILGVDLGAYSVKVVVAQAGFRQASVADFIERPVPAGDEPYEVRAARVLGEIVHEHKLEHDFPYAAVPGDKLFIHVLEFPFRNLSRARLEDAVGPELEAILPIDLEDIVFGFEPLPQDMLEPATDSAPATPAPPLGSPLADDEPTFVQQRPAPPAVVHGRIAPPTDGMRVLACAMETQRARELLDLISDQLAEPRGLIAAPASYARIVQNVTQLTTGKAKGSPVPVALIDIGHARTDVCVVHGGRAVFARTILRGGRHLTERISREWRISFEEAEVAKHTDGFVGSAVQPPESEEWQRVHDVVVTEIAPLARDIKLTLNSCRAKTGVTIHEVILVGGGSRLRGLPAYLSEMLHVPVATLAPADAAVIVGEQSIQRGIPADIACLAAGVAFEGASGRPHFDLRQGELAFKADLSFLRQKAAVLSAAVLIIIAFAAVNAYASLYKLRTAKDHLATRLETETRELFGQPLAAEEALLRTAGQTGTSESPLPKMTAYDILLEINNAMPGREDAKINVGSLEIKQGKITIKVTAGSVAEMDKIEENLKKIECFKEVSRGSTSAGPDDVRSSSFSIKSSCM